MAVEFEEQRLFMHGKELNDDEMPDPKLNGHCVLELKYKTDAEVRAAARAKICAEAKAAAEARAAEAKASAEAKSAAKANAATEAKTAANMLFSLDELLLKCQLSRAANGIYVQRSRRPLSAPPLRASPVSASSVAALPAELRDCHCSGTRHPACLCVPTRAREDEKSLD